MFLVHRDTSTPDAVQRACDLALRLQVSRWNEGPPESITDFMFCTGSEDWHQVIIDLRKRRRHTIDGEKWTTLSASIGETSGGRTLAIP